MKIPCTRNSLKNRANDCDSCQKNILKKFAKFVLYLWLNLSFAWIRMFLVGQPATWKKLKRITKILLKDWHFIVVRQAERPDNASSRDEYFKIKEQICKVILPQGQSLFVNHFTNVSLKQTRKHFTCAIWYLHISK